MRVAFWSEEGMSIAWARRLCDEGTSVLVYRAKPSAKRIGDGLVPVATSREEWFAWGMADHQTIWFFDCTNNGHIPDRLRAQGRLVVGGGSFMDRLEMDRAFGQKFAETNGILVPPTKSFSSVTAAIAYMKSTKQQEVGDGGWAWKPDRDLGCSVTLVDDAEKVISSCERLVIPRFGDSVKCIVQERVPGVALSTARWWNGMSWTGPYEGTLEEKKFMDGDMGPATGCSLNTVWFYLEATPKIASALKWDDLALGMRKNNAPPGLYDINAVVNKQGAWFLEWTPRLGIDSELTSQLAFTSLSSVLYQIATGGEIDHLVDVSQGYHGVRVSVPPYPTENDALKGAKISMGSPVNGVTSLWHGDFVMAGLMHDKEGLAVGNDFGYVGTAVSRNRQVNAGFEQIAATIKKIDVAYLQARTDGAKIITADIEKMASFGWGTTPYLEIEENAYAR